MNINKDILGVVFSCVCLTHCLLFPVLLILGVSTISLTFLKQEWIHIALFVPMILLVILSIPKGLKIHNNLIPSLVTLFGVAFIISALFTSEKYEEIFTIVASLILISAHLLNLKLINKSNRTNN